MTLDTSFVHAILKVMENPKYVSVRLIPEAFELVNGFDKIVNPNLLPYTTFGDASGQGGRKFIIHGCPVYAKVRKNPETKRPESEFVMLLEDAQNHLSLTPWVPRTNEKADFAFSDYSVKQ